MKQTLFFLLLLLLPGLNQRLAAQTQTPPQPAAAHGGTSSVYGPATLGFAFGMGQSKQHINYQDAFDGEFLPARVFSFGLQYGKPISEHLAWQIELGLTQHGFRLKQTVYSYGVKVVGKADARVRYLELPFLLLYRQPVGKKGLTLAAAPGFSLGYATSAKIVTRASGKNDARNVHTKIEDNISLKGTAFGDRLDAALQLGARGEYPLKPGKVFLELRYHLGILNLDRNIGDSQDKTFNRSWLLRLGYCYALK